MESTVLENNCVCDAPTAYSSSISISWSDKVENALTRKFGYDYITAPIMDNIERLEKIGIINSFRNLKPNWDGYDADKISELIITESIAFIADQKLKYLPEVFPTPRGTIQFEFDKENGDFVEMELSLDGFEVYQKRGNNKEELKINKSEAYKLLNEFYS